MVLDVRTQMDSGKAKSIANETQAQARWRSWPKAVGYIKDHTGLRLESETCVILIWVFSET